MRKLRKILIILLILLVVTVIGGYALINSNWGQRNILDAVVNSLEDRLGVELDFEDVHVSFWNEVYLTNVYAEDQLGDTLLFVRELTGSISNFNFSEKNIVFSEVNLNDPKFNLRKREGETQSNIQMILDKLKNPDSDEKSAWQLGVEKVVVNNGHFKWDDDNAPYKVFFDSKHLDLKDINTVISEIDLEGLPSFTIESLSAKDISGFVIEDLQSQVKMTDTYLDLGQTKIITPQSNIGLSGQMNYEKGEYFEDFANQVKLTINLDEDTKFNLKELQYFTLGMDGTDEELSVSGKLTGTYNRLKGKQLKIDFGRRSSFKGNMTFDGLTDLKTAFINFKVKQISTDINDLKSLKIPVIEPVLASLPTNTERLGRLRFDGNFTGFLHDFAAYGNLYTAVGPLYTNIALIRDKQSGQLKTVGEVTTKDFKLNEYMTSDNVGAVSAELKIDAAGQSFRDMSANLEGVINAIEIRGYTYENLMINGFLDENLFEGQLSGDHEDLAFDFVGDINLQEKVPQFDFDLALHRADLTKLNLIKSESITNVTGKVVTHLRGKNIDDMVGQLKLNDLVLYKDQDSLAVDSITFYAQELENGKSYEIQSNLMNAQMQGNFTTKSFKPAMYALMDDVMPAWFDHEYEMPKDFNVNFNVEFKETAPITAYLFNDIQIDQGTHIEGYLDGEIERFKINGHTDSLKWRGIALNNFNLTAERYNDRAYILFENDETVVSDNIKFSDNIFTTYLYNDTLESDLTWSNTNLNSSGYFATFTHFTAKNAGHITLLPSELMINEENWRVPQEYQVDFNGKEVAFNELTFMSDEERIVLDGDLSENKNKELLVDIQKFQLNVLNDIAAKERFTFDGEVNMNGSVRDFYNDMALGLDLTVSDMVLKSIPVGDFTAKSTWDRNKRAFDLDGKIVSEGKEVLVLEGKYDPNAKGEDLSGKIVLDQLDLGLMALTNIKGVSNMGGAINGEVDLGGMIKKPELEGELQIRGGTFKVDFLNTTYTFDKDVIVEPDMFRVDNATMYDQEGNAAAVNAGVIHDNFRGWDYDVFAQFDNMLCFDLEPGMNDFFYGKGYGAGDVSIFGFGAKAVLEVEAKSNPGTNINIPLGESGDVQLDGFVSFVSSLEESVQKEYDISGLQMNLNLEVTDDAYFRLIFDEQIGDMMQGTGYGDINMELDERGDFNMYGNFTVKEGDYLFTLQNIVNKRFEVEEGGVITWYGNPYEAIIDIDAVYSVRTSLSVFANEFPDITQRNVLTLAKMNLSNRLLNPDISFEIDFPNLDPNSKSFVHSKVNSELELNRQFFSLLVLNTFISSQAGGGTGITASEAGLNTGVEFLTNQLSNWLSQISKDVQVGVNYRPGDQLTNQELAVVLSTHLFNERLLVTGNLGVSEANEVSGQKSALIGDFILEYMLTPEGRVRLKVFNETNDFNITTSDQAGTTQGIGIVLSREFDPVVK